MIFRAVRPFLTHDNAKLRDAVLVAAVPLAEHHALTGHRNRPAGLAHRLLSTSTDRHRRDRALDALNAWGHDTSSLENANDVAARGLRTGAEDHDLWWASNGAGERAEGPLF
ncbi:hypothetical protein [Streptomyces sp. SID14515]|uniref:hypothetical protein n=1 Tax=Streptomyces sp. SID14515 TaxID=2706074 RepID=UPI00194507ED|nr:hypothetical protein [Streptomyces sp. SID14515]